MFNNIFSEAQACEQVIKQRLQQVGLLEPPIAPTFSASSQPNLSCNKYRFSRQDPSVYAPNFHGNPRPENGPKVGDKAESLYESVVDEFYGSGMAWPWWEPQAEPEPTKKTVPIGVNFGPNQNIVGKLGTVNLLGQVKNEFRYKRQTDVSDLVGK